MCLDAEMLRNDVMHASVVLDCSDAFPSLWHATAKEAGSHHVHLGLSKQTHHRLHIQQTLLAHDVNRPG